MSDKVFVIALCIVSPVSRYGVDKYNFQCLFTCCGAQNFFHDLQVSFKLLLVLIAET